MDIHFTKMHGLGNDFIVLNNLHNAYQLSAKQIAALGHRQFGVGFDQLLLVEAATEPGIDFSYRIFMTVLMRHGTIVSTVAVINAKA